AGTPPTDSEYVTAAADGFDRVTVYVAVPAGTTVCAAGVSVTTRPTLTVVAASATEPGVPWLTKSSAAPVVTCRTESGCSPVTSDCQVKVRSVVPNPSDRCHTRVSKPDPGIVCVGAALKEPATTATPVAFGTRTETVTGVPSTVPMS